MRPGRVPGRAATAKVAAKGEIVSETITLKLVEHGEDTVEVDREEYEAAKAEGKLDHFLDAYASDIDTETVVIEPDGTEINPYT